MRMKSTLLSALLSFYFLSAFAQTPESILDSVNAGRQPEKVFTHFDRTFYKPGETIWFKTYITVDGRPGMLSSVLKAELISEHGIIIASQTLPVAIGSASGSLVLPANLRYGTYAFRVYTQHMLDMGADNFYYKQIPVLGSISDLNLAAPVTDISLQFFAESGTLLAGETNILALAAVDQQGRPASVNGIIKDSKGKDIVSFTTEYNGMGKIEMTPTKGEQYAAHYTLPSGSSRAMSLPAVVDEGTNLLVIDEVLKKRLIVSSRFFNEAQKPAFIIGEMDQVMLFKIDISKNNGRYMGRVPVQDLPGGLLHIAVFNAENKVLAERTCFVNSKNDTTAALLTGTTINLSKRAMNAFDFALPDSLEGTFSIAVIDPVSTPFDSPGDDIVTSTLVTSSLKTGANNPLYKLGRLSGLDKNDAIDLLLLVHPYKWNWETLTKLASIKLPGVKEDFISLHGKAFSEKGNKAPAIEAALAFIVQSKDSSVNSFTTKTDDSGNFSVSGMVYEDTAAFFVKRHAEKNRDMKVQLEILSAPLNEKYNVPVQAETLATQILPFLKISEQAKTKPVLQDLPAIDFDTTVKVLEELVVVSKPKDPTQLLEEKYTKGLFGGTARNTIDFVNNKPTYTGGNIFDYLKGRYSYIQVMGKYPDYMLVYRAMRSIGTASYIPMNLYLDEMPAEAHMLISVPMKDIALVRIYTTGFLGTGGALAVYRRKGEDGGTTSLFDNMTRFQWPGFSKKLSFYSPDYDKGKQIIKTDNRKTLYWNPSLTYIPEDGKVPVSFYNNDSCKEYKVILQGFTMDGKLLYIEKAFK